MLRDKLAELGIEYQAKAKYDTCCPKCSKGRKKSNTKSLRVFLNPSCVNFKCFHKGQCEWDTMQTLTVDNTSATEIQEEKIDFKVFPENIELPVHPDSTVYTYKDKNGNILFYIVRTKDKKFYPLGYGDDGEIYMRRPDFKTLYRAERLSNDDRFVLVVEGEKTADAAAQIFQKADVVTWVGGANNVKSGDWTLLNNRRVVLWPDNDKAGIDAMKEIAALIDSPEIYLCDVSKLAPKQDLADDLPMDLIKAVFNSKKNIAKPPVEGSINGSSFISLVSQIKTGLTMGWDNLDKDVRLPQSGLVVVEGRSGHGKTSFMINLAINVLRKYPDRPVVYFTYEIPAPRVLLKLLMAMEGVELSSVPHKNEEMYRTMLLDGELKAFSEVEPLLNQRLYITDADLDIEQIVRTLDSNRFQHAIVLVDYLQIIPARGFDKNRYLVIKDFADKLRAIGNKRNQVIITGSQLTRGETPYQDQAREGKDITNAAELVLKVWNKTVAEAHDEVRRNKEGEIVHYYDKAPGNFIIDVKKNRNGDVGKQYGFNLKFGTKLEVAELTTAF